MIGRGFRRGIRAVRSVGSRFAERRISRPQRTVHFIGGNMQEPEAVSLRIRKRAPVRPSLFQQRESSVDIGANEILRPADRPVHVAFRREMHNGAGPVRFQKLPDEFPIANIAVNEFISPVRRDALQIMQVPRVRQLIQIHDGCRFVLHPLQDEVGPDEPRAPGHQNMILHAKFGRFRTVAPQNCGLRSPLAFDCNKKGRGSPRPSPPYRYLLLSPRFRRYYPALRSEPLVSSTVTTFAAGFFSGASRSRPITLKYAFSISSATFCH